MNEDRLVEFLFQLQRKLAEEMGDTCGPLVRLFPPIAIMMAQAAANTMDWVTFDLSTYFELDPKEVKTRVIALARADIEKIEREMGEQ